LGLPTEAFGSQHRYSFLSGCTIPKLFLSGDQDSFAPAADLKQVVDAAGEPRTLTFIPGADHSFSGQLDAMQSALAGWLKEHVQ
jgi:alpha/beta superfamily hydrolase